MCKSSHNKCKNFHKGFTLVEVLIVVVIMAVLAATIIPQFTESTKDAKISSAKFNLHVLRSQIQVYKSQHNGNVPGATLAELTSKTDVQGTIGTGANFPYGPYVSVMPNNPFTDNNVVTAITNSPATAGDVTGTGGWLFNVATGELWIDHADYFTD